MSCVLRSTVHLYKLCTVVQYTLYAQKHECVTAVWSARCTFGNQEAGAGWLGGAVLLVGVLRWGCISVSCVIVDIVDI